MTKNVGLELQRRQDLGMFRSICILWSTASSHTRRLAGCNMHKCLPDDAVAGRARFSMDRYYVDQLDPAGQRSAGSARCPAMRARLTGAEPNCTDTSLRACWWVCPVAAAAALHCLGSTSALCSGGGKAQPPPQLAKTALYSTQTQKTR